MHLVPTLHHRYVMWIYAFDYSQKIGALCHAHVPTCDRNIVLWECPR